MSDLLQIVASEENGEWLYALSRDLRAVPQDGEKLLSDDEQAEFHRKNPDAFPEYHAFERAPVGKVPKRVAVVPQELMDGKERAEFKKAFGVDARSMPKKRADA